VASSLKSAGHLVYLLFKLTRVKMKKLLAVLLPFVFVFVSVPAFDISDYATLADLPFSPPHTQYDYEPRQITEIVIHHSGSFPADDSPEANAAAVESYRNYHKNSVHPGIYADQNTWAWHFDQYTGTWYQMPAQEGYYDGVSGPNGYNYNDIDYHVLIGTDGNVYQGRRFDTVGWHASNWEANVRSLGVCFIGCFDLHEPSSIQYWAGVGEVAYLMRLYKITVIRPHSYYANKSCPGYAFPLARFITDCRRYAGLYTDVDYSYWADSAIAFAGQKNIVTGYPDGSFRPENSITRAEFVYMLWKASGSPDSVSYFADTADHWAKKAIGWALENHLINGHADGLFHPDEPVTRAQAAKITYNFKPTTDTFRYYVDVPWSYWAAAYIYSNSYMTGFSDGLFHPDDYLTRAQACTVLQEILR